MTVNAHALTSLEARGTADTMVSRSADMCCRMCA
jgi:hypothetical protein